MGAKLTSKLKSGLKVFGNLNIEIGNKLLIVLLFVGVISLLITLHFVQLTISHFILFTLLGIMTAVTWKCRDKIKPLLSNESASSIQSKPKTNQNNEAHTMNDTQQSDFKIGNVITINDLSVERDGIFGYCRPWGSSQWKIHSLTSDGRMLLSWVEQNHPRNGYYIASKIGWWVVVRKSKLISRCMVVKHENGQYIPQEITSKSGSKFYEMIQENKCWKIGKRI